MAKSIVKLYNMLSHEVIYLGSLCLKGKVCRGVAWGFKTQNNIWFYLGDSKKVLRVYFSIMHSACKASNLTGHSSVFWNGLANAKIFFGHTHL